MHLHQFRHNPINSYDENGTLYSKTSFDRDNTIFLWREKLIIRSRQKEKKATLRLLLHEENSNNKLEIRSSDYNFLAFTSKIHF